MEKCSMKNIGLSPDQYELKVKPEPKPEPKPKKNKQKEVEQTSTTHLFYACVQAEAGNQDLMGQQLVADVILNRVADPRFPNTIEEVIYSPGQFSVVQNGALKKAQGNISPQVVQAVNTELTNERLNTDVLYFNNSNNGGWKYGGHWFK